MSDENKDVDPLLSIEEVATFFDVHPHTIRRWYEAGIIPKPLRYGKRCLRWRRSVIEQAAQHQNQTTN